MTRLTSLEVALGAFADAVVARVAGALATQAGLPEARAGEVRSAGHGLVVAAREAGMARLRVRLTPEGASLGVLVGPVPEGLAATLAQGADPHTGRTPASLADAHHVEPEVVGRGELLLLRFEAHPEA